MHTQISTVPSSLAAVAASCFTSVLDCTLQAIPTTFCSRRSCWGGWEKPLPVSGNLATLHTHHKGDRIQTLTDLCGGKENERAEEARVLTLCLRREIPVERVSCVSRLWAPPL